MKLTEKQKQIITERLTHLDTSQCSCGKCEWIINDTIFELREFHGGNIVVGGKSTIFPIVPIVCAKCGKATLYSAVYLGILTSGKEQDASKS